MIVFTAAAIMSVTGAIVSLLHGKPVHLVEAEPLRPTQADDPVESLGLRLGSHCPPTRKSASLGPRQSLMT
jgi:hypothetical protein